MWKAQFGFWRFPRPKKIPNNKTGDFPQPSFPRPFRTRPQLLEEFVLSLLHALGCFGVADGSDAL